MERLQKVIAQAGICSRRKAEELILDGKVKVNGKVAELGMKVSGNDTITVSGKPLKNREEKVYYLLNKPKGCITSVSDEKDRKTVLDYMPDDKRIYPVGRLDYDTSGVLLLTNDGAFTNLMIHPRYQIPKVYEVNLQGMLDEEDLKKLRRGFTGSEGTFAPAKVRIKQKDYTRDRMQIDLTIYEGQNHQVKNMMKSLGKEVRRLNRKQFGDLDADKMKPGEYRKLKAFEVDRLRSLAQNGSNDQKTKGRRK